MAQQDPLRQMMTMVEDLRRNVDSMISQGTRRIRSSVPALPFPGGATPGLPAGLPSGPQDLLAKLPALPELPGMQKAKAAIPPPRRATSKYLQTGPKLQVHPKEWHNSHTLSPSELASLPSILRKNGVPTPAISASVLTK